MIHIYFISVSEVLVYIKLVESEKIPLLSLQTTSMPAGSSIAAILFVMPACWNKNMMGV
jgi:hypothetical protein